MDRFEKMIAIDDEEIPSPSMTPKKSPKKRQRTPVRRYSLLVFFALLPSCASKVLIWQSKEEDDGESPTKRRAVIPSSPSSPTHHKIAKKTKSPRSKKKQEVVEASEESEEEKEEENDEMEVEEQGLASCHFALSD